MIAPVDVRLPKAREADDQVDTVVQPVDRLLMVYWLIQGQYGRSDAHDLAGETAVGVLPGVIIRWDALLEIQAIKRVGFRVHFTEVGQIDRQPKVHGYPVSRSLSGVEAN